MRWTSSQQQVTHGRWCTLIMLYVDVMPPERPNIALSILLFRCGQQFLKHPTAQLVRPPSLQMSWWPEGEDSDQGVV